MNQVLEKTMVRGYYRLSPLGKLSHVPPYMRHKVTVESVHVVFQVGDKVRLVNPGNPLLKNKIGQILNINKYGKLIIIVEGRKYLVAPDNAVGLDNVHIKRAQEFRKLGDSPPYRPFEESELHPKARKALQVHVKKKYRDVLKKLPKADLLSQLRVRAELIGQLIGLHPDPKKQKLIRKLQRLRSKIVDLTGIRSKKSELDKEIAQLVPKPPVEVKKTKVRLARIPDERSLVSTHALNIEKKLLGGKIKSRTPLASSSDNTATVEAVTLTSKIVGVFKRRHKEGSLLGVERKSLPERERAAYLISQVLRKGYDMVPPTVVAAGSGSMQQMVDGEEVLTASKDLVKDFGPRTLTKLAVFDFVTGQADRHQMNAMREEFTGRLWAIDNGYCLGDNTDTPFKSFAMAEMKDVELDDDVLAPLKRLQDPGVMALISSYVGEKSVKRMMNRVDWLLAKKHFPRLEQVGQGFSGSIRFRVPTRDQIELYPD